MLKYFDRNYVNLAKMLKQDSHNFEQHSSSVFVHSLHKLNEGKETLIPLHQDQKEPLANTSGLQ